LCRQEAPSPESAVGLSIDIDSLREAVAGWRWANRVEGNMLDPLSAVAVGACVLAASLFLARLIPDHYDDASWRRAPARKR
jgi:hypothetical protein